MAWWSRGSGAYHGCHGNQCRRTSDGRRCLVSLSLCSAGLVRKQSAAVFIWKGGGRRGTLCLSWWWRRTFLHRLELKQLLAISSSMNSWTVLKSICPAATPQTEYTLIVVLRHKAPRSVPALASDKGEEVSGGEGRGRMREGGGSSFCFYDFNLWERPTTFSPEMVGIMSGPRSIREH